MAVEGAQARVERSRFEDVERARAADEAPEAVEGVEQRALAVVRDEDRFERGGGVEEKRRAALRCPEEPGRALSAEMSSADWQSSTPVSWDEQSEGSELDPAKIGSALGDQPPQLIWTDLAVDIENQAGREQGGLSAEQAEKNKALAGLAAGAEKLEPIELAALARESGVALEKQDPAQLVAATNYVNRATSSEDQKARLEKALNNFSILDSIGAPKLDESQFVNVMWDAARIPGHAIDNFSQDKKDKTFKEVAAALNTPGKTELKIDNYKVKIETDQNNQLVDSSTKKKSPWGTIGKIALNVGLGVAATFTGGATLIAARLIASGIGVVNGIRNKSVLGTIAGAAGAFGAAALGAGASTAANVASGVARTARAVQSGISAFRARSASGILGAVADGAGAAAGFVARGAEGWQQNFQNVARWAGRGSTAAGVVEGVRDGQYLRAAGEGMNLIGSGVGARGETADRFGRVGRAVAGMQSGDVSSVAAAATGLAAGLSQRGDVRELARMTAAIDSAERARRSGDSGMLAEAMIGLGEQVRSTRQYLSRAQTVIQIPNRSPAGAPPAEAPPLPLLESRPLAGLENMMLAGLPAPVEPTMLDQLAPAAMPYTVKRGDTIEALAARNGLTTRELLDANGLDENSARRLQIGQTLEIPLETNNPRGAENLRNYRENARLTAQLAEFKPLDERALAKQTLTESEGYQLLNPTLRGVASAAVSSNPSLANDVVRLANSPQYRNLNDATKLELLDAMTRLDPISRSALRDLSNAPGLASMSDREKMKLAQLVDGTNRDVAEPSRNALWVMIGKPEFVNADAQGQARQLQNFLRTQPGLHPNMGQSPNVQATETNRVALRAIPTAPSRGGQDFMAEINGQRIMISMPATHTAGMSIPSAGDIARGLAEIPESSRRLISNVIVSPSPMDRAYMSVSTGPTVTVYPTQQAQTDRYLRESLIHEAGHIASINLWGNGDNDARWNPWTSAMRDDGVAVSAYAINGRRRQFEDFAETWALYSKVRGTATESELREVFGARFRVLDSLVGR